MALTKQIIHLKKKSELSIGIKTFLFFSQILKKASNEVNGNKKNNPQNISIQNTAYKRKRAV